MTKFHFILDVKLPPGSPDPMTYLDALREGGCDDATIGIGKRSLRLHISRDGTDLYRVIAQAEASVRRTIPDARIRWRWDREVKDYDREHVGSDDQGLWCGAYERRRAISTQVLASLRTGAKRALAALDSIDESLGFTKEQKEAFSKTTAGRLNAVCFYVFVGAMVFLVWLVLEDSLSLGN